METIKVTDFSNEAASKTKGEALKGFMEAFLKENKDFSIDFTGITRYSSPFFNNSFAKLALLYGFEKIKAVNLSNISETGLHTYHTSLDNALFISEKPEYSEKFNVIINNNLPKKDD